MKGLDEIEAEVLKTVAGLDGIPEGAYNFRVNGKSISRQSSDNINIVPREDGDGIKIYISGSCQDEAVHIPVIISHTGLSEVVYNDFYVEDGADVTIVAGCGIYNCGPEDSIHDGVHTFHIGANARVRYIEKHYGGGPGAGRILNPRSVFYVGAGAVVEVEMEQIRGVDSTRRDTRAELEGDAKIVIDEKLMTHGRQEAESTVSVKLKGDDSTCDIISRAVATDESQQKFNLAITGQARCRGHAECDAILKDKAKVLAIPSLDARCLDAELIHEAAIGKVADEQITKLMTLGLSRADAESQIINGFLR